MPDVDNLADCSFRFCNGGNFPMMFMSTNKKNSFMESVHFIRTSIDAGYRSFEIFIDDYTMALALPYALSYYDLKRENIFVLLKCNIDATMSPRILYHFSKRRLSTFLRTSGIEYADVLIMYSRNRHYKMQRALWDTMQQLALTDIVDNIGLYNPPIHYLYDFLLHAEVLPMVVQILYNPIHQQRKLVKYCISNGIRVQGYNLFGEDPTEDELLIHPLIKDIAIEHRVIAAQVLLLWSIKNGVSVKVNANSKYLIKKYFQLTFALTTENMVDLNNLE